MEKSRGNPTWAVRLSLPLVLLGLGEVADPLSLSTKAHMAHYFSRGGSGNPPALRFSPKSPGTLPVSEYSRPIYQYLCLDHFFTPRYVHDHIRDSELP